MLKHTKTPWSLNPTNDYEWTFDSDKGLRTENVLDPKMHVHVIDGFGLATIAVTQVTGRTNEPFDQEEGNAAWIVKCVNFIGL